MRKGVGKRTRKFQGVKRKSGNKASSVPRNAICLSFLLLKEGRKEIKKKKGGAEEKI